MDSQLGKFPKLYVPFPPYEGFTITGVKNIPNKEGESQPLFGSGKDVEKSYMIYPNSFIIYKTKGWR